MLKKLPPVKLSILNDMYHEDSKVKSAIRGVIQESIYAILKLNENSDF